MCKLLLFQPSISALCTYNLKTFVEGIAKKADLDRRWEQRKS